MEEKKKSKIEKKKKNDPYFGSTHVDNVNYAETVIGCNGKWWMVIGSCMPSTPHFNCESTQLFNWIKYSVLNGSKESWMWPKRANAERTTDLNVSLQFKRQLACICGEAAVSSLPSFKPIPLPHWIYVFYIQFSWALKRRKENI